MMDQDGLLGLLFGKNGNKENPTGCKISMLLSLFLQNYFFQLSILIVQGKLLYTLVTSETSFLSQTALEEQGKIDVSGKILMGRVEQEKGNFDGKLSCRKYYGKSIYQDHRILWHLYMKSLKKLLHM